MIVDNGVPQLRETGYDQDAAVGELRASGFVDLDDHLGGSLLDPVDPDWVAGVLRTRGGSRRRSRRAPAGQVASVHEGEADALCTARRDAEESGRQRRWDDHCGGASRVGVPDAGAAEVGREDERFGHDIGRALSRRLPVAASRISARFGQSSAMDLIRIPPHVLNGARA
jgi:hypothetical protein